MIAMNIVTLPPGTMSTSSGETSAPRRRCEVLRHRLAQGGDSRRVGIAVLAVAQRLDGGLDDMGRGFEIGLADAEIDDVAPLALQFGRPRQHGEGVLLADALEGGIDGDGQGACLRVRRPFWQSRAAGARAQGLGSASKARAAPRILRLFDNRAERARLEVAARMDWHGDGSRRVAAERP